MPDEQRLFTVEEAQELLDGGVREAAERIVALRADWRPLQRRWWRVVLAVGSNGGALSIADTERLRVQVEEVTESLNLLITEVGALGIQIKDLDSGLLDFPAEIDGGPALLCWRVGEDRIGFWHSPEDGFAGRRPLP